MPPGPAVAPTTGAPALTPTNVLTGVGTKVWDIGFTPDGMLLTEFNGAISKYVGSNTRQVICTPPDVVVAGEGGMLGMAIDPTFASNRFIYTCFNSNRSGTNDVRLVRWTVSPDYSQLTNRTDIVTGLPMTTGRHSGCRPRFQPSTGHLFVGTGDAATGTNPQSTSSLGGKVLRVDRNGAAISGNPFFGATPGDDRIFTFGHRNVQGIAFRPGTGVPFSAEHGPGVQDELNKLQAGGNYGWDPVPGYNEGVPMTDTTKFPAAIPATWNSGGVTVAPSGLTFLSGAQWGDWDGRAVLGCLDFSNTIGQRLIFLQLNAAGDGFTARDDSLADGIRKRTVVQGPDGALYVGTDSGTISRVVPS